MINCSLLRSFHKHSLYDMHDIACVSQRLLAGWLPKSSIESDEPSRESSVECGGALEEARFDDFNVHVKLIMRWK